MGDVQVTYISEGPQDYPSTNLIKNNTSRSISRVTAAAVATWQHPSLTSWQALVITRSAPYNAGSDQHEKCALVQQEVQSM